MVFPYLAISWKNLYSSVFFSWGKLGLVLITLIIVELLFKWATNKNNRMTQWVNILFVTIVILFFYGTFFIVPTIDFLNSFSFVHIFREKNITIGYFILLILIQAILIKRQGAIYRLLNIFFLILFIVVVVGISLAGKGPTFKNINEIKSAPIKFPNRDSIRKPVILVIADEYASPDELYKVFKDSSVYAFSKELIKQGWLVDNGFYSYDTSTIHSLSSLFNYNLSTSREYINEPLNVVSQKQIHSALNDSLEKNFIPIINFGIFDIGKSGPLTRLYYFPKNFLEPLLFNSLFPGIFLSNNLPSINDHGRNYFPSEDHDKKIFDNFADSISKFNRGVFFAYVHLYMPHSPLLFRPEFAKRDNSIKNYLAYWKFTTDKLRVLLQTLTAKNQYRIILTGDHGKRSAPGMDSHQTFSCFWGFKEENVKKLLSVQDLGSLINESLSSN